MADEERDNEELETEAGEATEADETVAEATDAGATGQADADAEASADEEAPAAEEKPKRRRRAKKADDSDAAAEEPTADEVAAKAKPDEVDKPRRRRRRGAAEVSAGSERKLSKRTDEGKVVVRAKARYVRCAPRKARLVVDTVRGKSVDEARAILIHTPRAASRDVLKLLDSAIANAENNHELVADELKIDRVFVDEGPTLKRFRPRALGRATQIRKRTSHMTILLTPKE
jgi:ribosomal protein L22